MKVSLRQPPQKDKVPRRGRGRQQGRAWARGRDHGSLSRTDHAGWSGRRPPDTQGVGGTGRSNPDTLRNPLHPPVNPGSGQAL